MNINQLPESYRAVVEEVLEQIRKQCPDDHRLLQDFVESVEVFDFDDDTMGELVQTRESSSLEEIQSDLRLANGIVWSKILIAPDLTNRQLRAVFAHECGHAATTLDDLEESGGPSDEWKSELAADRKAAFHWGFGEEILELRKQVEEFHHATSKWIELDGTRWRISEELKMKEVCTEGITPKP